MAQRRDEICQEGFDVSESYRFRILRGAGLTTTRQQRSTPQPGEYAHDGSVVPDVADVRICPWRRAAIPDQGRRPLPVPSPAARSRPARAVAAAGLPGSEQVPPLQALLALLTPKLLGKRRVSHISDL